MKTIVASFLSVSLFFLIGCQINYRYKDQNKAAKAAEDFAAAAFVKKDFSEAGKFLFLDPKQGESEAKLKDLTYQMHPNDKFPTIVRAQEYEIVPGGPFIKIYLKGADENRALFYYFFVVATADDNTYKITEIYRSINDQSYPPTNLVRQKLDLVN